MMKLLTVEVNRNETVIYKVLVDEGKFRPLKTIKGKFMEQAELIFLHALKERPSKIIVEDVGIGTGVLDSLVKVMDNYGMGLKADGTVVYK